MKVYSLHSIVLQQGGIRFFTSSKKWFLYLKIQPDFLYISQVKAFFRRFCLILFLSPISMPGYNSKFFSYWLVIKNWFLLKICSGSRNLRLRRGPFHYFIVLLHLTSYLTVASDVSTEHCIWYKLFSHQDKIFVHIQRFFRENRIQMPRILRQNYSCHKSDTGLDRALTSMQQDPFFLVVVLTSFQMCKETYRELLSYQACWIFKTERKDFLIPEQCPITIWLQDTFIIKRRRITRVVTLRSSSELESLSLSFKSW